MDGMDGMASLYFVGNLGKQLENNWKNTNAKEKSGITLNFTRKNTGKVMEKQSMY